MKKAPLFSLVIFPTSEELALIRSYKQMLKSEIGWFGSANAAGHITVMNFDDEPSLNLHLGAIKDFCKTAASQNVTLDNWASFGDHTFFLAPNPGSQAYLDQLILNLHNHLGIKGKNIHAHLSIARSLDAEKMEIAYELFQNIQVTIQFSCNAFHLRKFNEGTQQYSDIIEKIDFGTR